MITNFLISIAEVLISGSLTSIVWDGNGHKTLTNYFTELGFSLPSPNTVLSIHNPSSIKFSKCVLNAGVFSLNILKQGLKFNFTSMLPSNEEDNNKNSREILGAVREKVNDWLLSNSVEKVTLKPFCINPLNLVTKIDNVTGKIKHRPCIDMSRHLNPLMKEEKCKLEDLSIAEQLVDKNDFMCTLDLKNQFFHVQLNSDYKKYLV